MELVYIVKNNDKLNNVKEVLKNRLNISSRLISKLKTSKSIFLNDKICYANEIVKENDCIRVILNFEEDNTNIIPIKMNLDIIYEDDAYIVINKPSNMPVHPSSSHTEDSLSNGLKFYFDEIGLIRKLRPVIRLDKDTSRNCCVR